MQFRTLRADEIEVRVSQVTQYGASVLLYKNARADMNLLDETVTPINWYNTYEEIKGNLFCTLFVRDSEDKPFVGKQDCGIESREDNGNEKKGEASDAFKRAGFRWGLGRELYTAPRITIDLEREKDERGRWKLKRTPYLFVSEIAYDDNRRISKLVIKNKNDIVYVYPANVIPDEDLDMIEKQRAGKDPSVLLQEISQLKKVIFALADNDLEKIRGVSNDLGWGPDIGNLTLDQYRRLKVELANRIENESQRS